MPQPHSVELAVHDLNSLPVRSGLPTPYILVAHSYEGYIASLYTRRYPDSVGGLVMVDAANELMEQAVSPEKFAFWAGSHQVSAQRSEAVKLAEAGRLIREAGPLPVIPAVVISSDKWLRLDLLPSSIASAPRFLTGKD